MPAPAFEHIGNRADGWGPIVGRGDDYDDRHRREAGKKKKFVQDCTCGNRSSNTKRSERGKECFSSTAGCSVEQFALAKIPQPKTNNNVCMGSCLPHFSRRVQCLHHQQPSSRLQVAKQIFQRMESTNEFVHMNILTSSYDNI